MMTSPRRESSFKLLRKAGQAVWLDFLARRLLSEGRLEKLVIEDGLSGVTSNPSIFEKAIAESADYDAFLKETEHDGDFDVMTLYERLAIEDIRQAADILRPVYDTTKRADGYVSLEVSPYLAMDTEATVDEARRLAKAVGRENVMFKVPATKPGLPAISHLIGEGFNINVTLLFSQNIYEEVAEAYFAGLEHFIEQGGDPSRVASVASFFVSRIDVAVDKLVEKQLGRAADTAEREALSALRGKVAIANAKLAYQRYKRIFSGARWERLKARGARVQRLLWASTSTKNSDYSDVLYVEELIGEDTVNTMPPATMEAFRDHGRVHPSLEQNIDDAERIMAALERCGISIDALTAQLTQEGVALFADAFDKLLGAVARKRAALLGEALNNQIITLPAELEREAASASEAWRRAGNVRRLWSGDTTLWTTADEDKWVGWLSIVEEQRKRIGELEKLGEDVRRRNFKHAVLLGMGGSSLGAEVLARTFGNAENYPELLILDSTDPAQIHAIEQELDLARTLFIVSSKSGTTLEPNILKAYFFERVKKALGDDQAGAHFAAITDPGSKLEGLAESDGFWRCTSGKPSIGGRYSVLSDFGMVPGAAIGLNAVRFLGSAQKMVHSCGSAVPPADNPGVALGISMGAAAKAGRDKITIIASPAIASFGAWLEQLLAESTGKKGKGLIPVNAEPLGAVNAYGQDRLFAYVRLTTEADPEQDKAIAALKQAGQPVVHIEVTGRYQLGQEFFRWEIATAVAGAIIGINPFDQPDVEASKIKARELTDAFEKKGSLPAETPILQDHGAKVFADDANAKVLKQAGDGRTLIGSLKAHLGRLHSGDYCALLAYVARDDRHERALQDIRVAIRDAKRVATCVGFGPRFLHSTGQAYKGGPNSGVFLEITYETRDDIPVPDHKYSFGSVIAAQARGDFAVLNKSAQRALRIHLGADVNAGLENLTDVVRKALM
ncbi:MAG: bifunctional transaldolase/phosoglucose isomerase [Pseudolabrys sp.]